ncbi:MAG: 16S rRNA (uracil(1498)-N(3))-methyltransferase [Gammaproteobacteria bacterium]
MATRVFEPQELATEAEVSLGERNQQHLVRVLRMTPGDTFVIFNGDGAEYGAQLVSTGKREAIARIGAWRKPAVESPLTTHLGQVLSKGDRMEYAIQKAVELGVTTITLLTSTRCEIRLDNERQDKKLHHLQNVAIHAAEQSGRVHVPALRGPMPLADWVAEVDAKLKLVLHPGAGTSALPANCTTAALLVGPEGGLTEEEVGTAARWGFSPATIGPRVLRTETAPAVALAVLQSRYGDFAGI